MGAGRGVGGRLPQREDDGDANDDGGVHAGAAVGGLGGGVLEGDGVDGW